MPRFFLASLLTAVALLLTTGCLGNGSLSAIEYNNQVVDVLNKTSAAIESTTTLYDSGIPNIVTEEAEIETTEMQTALNEAKTQVESANRIMELVSKNAEQQAAVNVEFTTYLTLAKTYLENYEAMITYYSTKTFVQDLNGVAEHDEKLHSDYNNFIESNNKLVDVLAQYVD